MENLLLICLLFIPASVVFSLLEVNQSILFIIAVISLLPLAHFIGKATEAISLQTNPTVGGFVNATFGNIIELIISLIAINIGLIDLVKASIVGSIIANILLLIGLSMFFGGLKFKEQQFNTTAAGVSSTMLLISVFGLAIPSIYTLTHSDVPLQLLSDIVSIVLAMMYVLGLVFAFFTHKHLFDPIDQYIQYHVKPPYPVRKALIILLLSIIAVVFESKLLVHSVEVASAQLGLTQLFIGIVIIPIVTNLAEKLAAVRMAMKNNIDLSIEIGTSSAVQIALFVTPILVLFSHFLNSGFTLIFPPFRVIAMVFAVMIVNYLSSDGRCNWLEGAQLITVYLIMAITFFF